MDLHTAVSRAKMGWSRSAQGDNRTMAGQDTPAGPWLGNARQLEDVAGGDEHAIAEQESLAVVVHQRAMEQPRKLKVHGVDLI